MVRSATALALALGLALAPTGAAAEVEPVTVHRDERGFVLQIDGRDFMVFGMNWGYEPIGDNYSYSLWSKGDAFIEKVLHRDMALLSDMGVNTIRQGPSIPPRWVAWIHEHYGIYTAMNHTVGRYGATIDGAWIANIDYANPAHRRALTAEVVAMVERYRGTPGILMWLLGNENNYGLHWTSYEAETLPGAARDARAAALYSLFGEIIAAIDARDHRHPIAIANGDLQYIDLIATHCKGLDILGSNVYRGASARDLFDVVLAKLELPVMFTEFGADAFNARTGEEDATAQARYLRAQWQEIYEHSHGKGRAGNAIGGLIFQWADGWWKHGQDSNLDVHDTTASWPNEGYPHDFVAGQNNMNEEWFGVVAIEPPDDDGFYELRPRTAYYLLAEAFELEPYAETTTLAAIRTHFDALRPSELAPRYETTRALAKVAALERFRVADLRLRIETIGSSGSSATERADDLTVDHTESFFIDFEFRPSARSKASLSINLVGNAAQNRLDPLFYENRIRGRTPGSARTTALAAEPGVNASTELERLAIYRAELEADYELAKVVGFFRAGHGHWGYEGDFFGLYRESYYGPSIDTYQADVPFGAELTGKGPLEGLALAFGPEVYWGANPTIIGKYRRTIGPVTATLVHQEDLARAGATGTSAVVPEPVTRRTALHLGMSRGRLTFDLGGLFAAPRRVGERYVWTEASDGDGYLGSGFDVFEDEIGWKDTVGVKAKLTAELGRVSFYTHGGLQGLVADGGPDPTITFTGWSLKPTGRGNHAHAAAGFVTKLGSLQLGPNLLYQRPLVGPNPLIEDRVDPETGRYFPAVKPRNVVDDPFAVLDNRETFGGELMLVYDPTPATWFWAWDAIRREDSRLAGALSFAYRHQPTSRDSNLGFLADGTQFAFDAAPSAEDVWESRLRLISAPATHLRLAGELYLGRDQARGLDDRLVTRYGGSLQLWWRTLAVRSELKLDDWGPYDYYRDYNLTFPIQVFVDGSYGMRAQSLGIGDVRLGLRGQLRTLDQFSPGYVANPDGELGVEYELLSYLGVNL